MESELCKECEHLISDHGPNGCECGCTAYTFEEEDELINFRGQRDDETPEANQ